MLKKLKYLLVLKYLPLKKKTERISLNYLALQTEAVVLTFGEKSEAYNRKAKQRNLLKDGEKLACADLLKCFGCPEQVIVQSVSDIWCLLSFKECIKESLYLHLNTHHYRQNFERTIIFITENIIPKLKKNILKQAKVMLNDKGLHPHWDDAESIIAMIPKTHSKMPKELN